MQTDLNKLNRITFSIVALAGIFISIKLLLVYYNANFNPNAGPSFCAVNEYLDCDAVAQTAYSRFLGVPFALWGFGFYTFVLGISLFPFHKFELFKEFKHPKSYIFTLAVISVIVSLILIYISNFIIGKACMLCQSLYLTNATFFISSKLGSTYGELFKTTLEDIKAILADKRWLNIAIVSVLTGIILLVLINIYQPFAPQNPIPEFKADEHYKIGTIGNILGDKDAKVVIKEYTDYECPFCSISNKMMLKLSKELDGVRIEHYDYPLDKTCNPFVKNSAHKNSCTAIYYAKAARNQGKFWDLSTLLYENRGNLSEENILKLAESIGLDVEKLKQDVKNNKSKYNQEVRADLEKAHSLGIDGTPTYIIGIKKYAGIMPYPQLRDRVFENF